MNVNSKILVTGGTGLIGAYLLRGLLDAGYKNVSVIHLPTDPLDLVSEFKDQINWLLGDVTDLVSIHDYFIETDVVIHCAGVISFWRNEFDKMFAVNVDGTANVVNLSLQHNIKELVHLSSIEALGMEEDNSTITEQTEYKEEMQHTQYANTKYLGELEVWRGHAEGLNTVIYNPALVLGTGYWDDGPMKIVKDIYQGLNYYPDGSYAMIDVRDLVYTIIRNLGKESMYGQRFIAGSHNIKYKYLFDQIAKCLGVKAPQKTLTGIVKTLAITGEKIRSLITRSKPLVNKETLLIVNQDLHYSFDKLDAHTEHHPFLVDKTIEDMCDLFKTNYQIGSSHGLLPRKILK